MPSFLPSSASLSGLNEEAIRYCLMYAKDATKRPGDPRDWNRYLLTNSSKGDKYQAYYKPWYEVEEVLKGLYQLTYLFVCALPKNCCFVGVGQSPAWMLKMGQQITQTHRQKPISFISIAFSKRFLIQRGENDFAFIDDVYPDKGGWYTEGVTLADYLARNYEEPTVENAHKYRAYLHALNLDAGSIIKRGRVQAKTIVFDYVESAESLASFLLMLFSTCKDAEEIAELKKHLHVMVLVSEFRKPFSEVLLPQYGMVKVETLELEKPYKRLMTIFAECKNEDGAPGRLLPYYAPRKWDKGPEEYVVDHELNCKIEEKMKGAFLGEI
jgi:hypothetical protein